MHNGACAKHEVYKCSDIPLNAEFYLDDDTNLTANQTSIYSTTNTNKKCEWKCKNAYELVTQYGKQYCLPEFRCYPNEKAAVGGIVPINNCSTRNNKIGCEGIGWDGSALYACDGPFSFPYASELRSHECGVMLKICGKGLGCVSGGYTFLGRPLSLNCPNAVEEFCPYAVPTACKRTRWADPTINEGEIPIGEEYPIIEP